MTRDEIIAGLNMMGARNAFEADPAFDLFVNEMKVYLEPPELTEAWYYFSAGWHAALAPQLEVWKR